MSVRTLKTSLIVSLTLAATLASSQTMVQGVVAVGERGCQKTDHVVIYTNLGFVLAQQYSGDFEKGDKVVGELNSYGMKDVLVNGRTGRLYIDDYMLGKQRAAEKCFGE